MQWKPCVMLGIQFLNRNTRATMLKFDAPVWWLSLCLSRTKKEHGLPQGFVFNACGIKMQELKGELYAKSNTKGCDYGAKANHTT